MKRIALLTIAVAFMVMGAWAKSPRYSSTEKLRTEIDTITLADVMVKASVNPVSFEVFPNLKTAKKAFKMPEFPGGDIGFSKLLRFNFRQPDCGLVARGGSQVQVNFVVGKDGSILDIHVKNAPTKEFAEELKLAFRRLPKIKPAKMNKQSSFAVGRCRINYEIRRGSLRSYVSLRKRMVVEWEPAQVPTIVRLNDKYMASGK